MRSLYCFAGCMAVGSFKSLLTMIGHFGHPVRELGGLCERESASETGQLKIAVNFIAIS